MDERAKGRFERRSSRSGWWRELCKIEIDKIIVNNSTIPWNVATVAI